MTPSDHAIGVTALVAYGWTHAKAVAGMDALAAMDDRPGGTPLTEVKATVFMAFATKNDAFKSALAEFCNPVARETIATLITIELAQ